jgi:hypothetical protein
MVRIRALASKAKRMISYMFKGEEEIASLALKHQVLEKPTYSSLGYARKVLNPERSYQRVTWLYYPDTPPQGAQFPSEVPG